MNDNIFTPKFVVTPTIKAALENVGRSAWLIQNMLIMPKHEAWIKRQVWVRRATATTRIEGASLTEKEVDQLSKRGPGGRATEDEQANMNALAAYEFIDYLSDERDVALDEMVVRQLNREFLRHMDDNLMAGRYRNGQNTVGPFTPPDQGDVPQLMRTFGQWLQADEEMNPILKAGITHINLAAIHPFWDANGRVARGLATLILQRSHLHFKKLLSLESFISEIRDEYFTAIERTLGSSYSPDYDATPWLEFFTRALARHAIELQLELTDWHRRMDPVHKALAKADLSHRQSDGIIFAIKLGRLTRAEYAEIANVSGVTASRDLANLVEKGWLIPQGFGRGRMYTPNTPGRKEPPPPEQGQLFESEDEPSKD